MLGHTGALWSYLGSFILYTLLAIGVIYVAFCVMRRNVGGLSLPGAASPMRGRKAKLQVESVLSLEARKNVYVLRVGHERFLVATSIEGTQFLSRLESLSDPNQSLPAAAASAPVSAPMPAMMPVSRPPHAEAMSEVAVGAPRPELPAFEQQAETPWYAEAYLEHTASAPVPRDLRPGQSFGSRLLQSVQWLITSRGGKLG